jgi:hypothetical protein
MTSTPACGPQTHDAGRHATAEITTQPAPLVWCGSVVTCDNPRMAKRRHTDLAGLHMGDIKPRRDIDPPQGDLPRQRDLVLGEAAQHLQGFDVPNPSRQALEAHMGRLDAELERAEQCGNISGAEHDLLRNYALLALEGRPMPDDHRTPLVVDGQVVALLDDPGEGLTQLLTLRLPRIIIDRLRDAAAALRPQRTMAGLATVGIQMMLDQLEAALIEQTGQGFPQRQTEVLPGGRPQRVRQPAAPKPADDRKLTRKIMQAIEASPKPVTMRQLGSACNITSPTLLAMHLRSLEAAGRISRGPKGITPTKPKRRRKGADGE